MRALFLAFVLGAVPALGVRPADLERELAARAFRYFVDHANPRTGLVRDRARNDGAPMSVHYDVASIAATGFGLAVLAHGARAGRIPRAEAESAVERTLRTVAELDHHRGWLYHFVDWETGARAYRSEVSTIDTALFLAGALYAGAVFPGTAVARLAGALYDRVDFEAMLTNGGTIPGKRSLSLGWLPETGYLPWNWDEYAEQAILLVLGLGHHRPLPREVWRSWSRGAYPYGANLPLFIHQYSQLFLDLRAFRDGYENYFENSARAVAWNRRSCLFKTASKTYASGLWGLSASGSRFGYRAFSPAYEDGTVCLGCAAASLPFLPRVVRSDFRRWIRHSEWDSLWGTYGFDDSVNLDFGWYDPDVLGITLGALYLALADAASDPVWPLFSRIPSVRRGLLRASLR